MRTLMVSAGSDLGLNNKICYLGLILALFHSTMVAKTDFG